MTQDDLKAYFEGLADEWDECYNRSLLFRQRYREFEKLIAEYADTEGTALDYGCGSGVLTGLLSQSFRRVVGTDLSDRMRSAAKMKFADCSSIEIKDIKSVTKGAFDLVICSSVIEYVENDLTFLQDIVSYLRPRGTLIITFPNRGGPLQTLNRLWTVRFRNDCYSQYQKRTYSRGTIRQLLAAVEMTVCKLYSPIGIPIIRRLGLGELTLCAARNRGSAV